MEFGLVQGDNPGPKVISSNPDNHNFGQVRAYGAGLLSSFGELEYACGEEGVPVGQGGNTTMKPKLLPWNPSVASSSKYPITTYQPTYFVAKSLTDAKLKMRSYCESLPRPFYARYNTLTDSIWVDRAVKKCSSSPKM